MSDAKTAEQAPIEQTPQPIPEVVQKQYDHLVETIRAYNPGADFAQIDAAFRYAAAHHGTQKRKDGSPYIIHPLAVAEIVAEIRAQYPDMPIMATGGPSDESILRTIDAGANAITYTPPSSAELFKHTMERYRMGLPYE